MNGKQYNSVIGWTLQQEQSEDTLTAARAVCNNLGVALPEGDLPQVAATLKSNDYMGWRSCTMQEAQAAADSGTAAIGVSDQRIVVLAAADEEQPVIETAAVMTLSETTSAYAVDGMAYYSYWYNTTTGCGDTTTTTNYPYVDIPQNGNIGTVISYMGYHLITATTSNQYKLKIHAINNGRYSKAKPEYYALIDGRIVIATKPNIGNQLQVAIGDYVQVKVRTNSGCIVNYNCIIGDFKGADADNIWGHYNGQGVVEVVYHDYSPPSGYTMKKTNIWDCDRVLRITKVGSYGNYK